MKIFKYKSLVTAKNKFNHLYGNKNQYCEEIIKLFKYIDAV